MYSVVPCLITLLIRSAVSSVFSSRCCRCKRTFISPSSPKITTIALSNSTFSLMLSVWGTRNQGTRVDLVSCMLQYRRTHRSSQLRRGQPLRNLFFLGEDRQVFHRDSEQREAHRDDHQGDGELRPFGNIVMAHVCLKTDKADVEAVGDETEEADHRDQIQAVGREPDLLEAEQSDGNEERQTQLEP